MDIELADVSVKLNFIFIWTFTDAKIRNRKITRYHERVDAVDSSQKAAIDLKKASNYF